MPAVVLIAVVGYIAGLAYAVAHTGYDIWGGIVIAPLLFAVTLPIVRRVGAKETDPRVRRLLVWALAAKLLATLLRYAVLNTFYDGVGDYKAYNAAGAALAPSYRNFLYPHVAAVPGTGFIKIVTGIIYAVTRPTMLGGFFVFSWLGFLGLLLFWRAVRIAVPQAEPLRYGLLLFFLPSLLFWPSSIGKEAWMTLTLGLAAYGSARLLAGRRPFIGILCGAIGLLGTAMVRPHVTVIAVGALTFAALLGRSTKSTFGPVGKAVTVAILLGGCFLAVQSAEKFFHISSTDGSIATSTTQVIDHAAQQTNEGGSAFQASRVTSVTQLPNAIVTVLFRPLPTEVHNATGLAASAEGMFVMLFTLSSWRRIGWALRSLRSTPYLAHCTAYTLIFVYAFSSFGNFGILTRERVQVFPFYLVLLCLPARRAARQDVREPTPALRPIAPLPRTRPLVGSLQI